MLSTTATLKSICTFSISLSPVETQKAIVAEIEEEQRLVQASREIADLFGRKIQGVVERVWGSADGDTAA